MKWPALAGRFIWCAVSIPRRTARTCSSWWVRHSIRSRAEAVQHPAVRCADPERDAIGGLQLVVADVCCAVSAVAAPPAVKCTAGRFRTRTGRRGDAPRSGPGEWSGQRAEHLFDEWLPRNRQPCTDCPAQSTHPGEAFRLAAVARSGAPVVEIIPHVRRHRTDTLRPTF